MSSFSCFFFIIISWCVFSAAQSVPHSLSSLLVLSVSPVVWFSCSFIYFVPFFSITGNFFVIIPPLLFHSLLLWLLICFDFLFYCFILSSDDPLYLWWGNILHSCFMFLRVLFENEAFSQRSSCYHEHDLEEMPRQSKLLNNVVQVNEEERLAINARQTNYLRMLYMLQRTSLVLFADQNSSSLWRRRRRRKRRRRRSRTLSILPSLACN